ncbi:hypothetical protein F5Y10DRAFT_190802 [Nemania abortiva]|nr:hypothetical protein F5Y10DRAFT_190802 [Nemania abortiva]
MMIVMRLLRVDDGMGWDGMNEMPTDWPRHVRQSEAKLATNKQAWASFAGLGLFVWYNCSYSSCPFYFVSPSFWALILTARCFALLPVYLFCVSPWPRT